MIASRVVLRPLTLGDEAAFVAAHRTLAADGFEFGLGFAEEAPWPAYVRRLADQRCGIGLEPGQVPATFLVGEVGGVLVGRISIRHELNDHLARFGGHVGYGVVPAYRRRGIATEMLRQGLVIAGSYGIRQVLLTCDDANVGSAAVIELCGGVLESRVTEPSGATLRRYWIER